MGFLGFFAAVPGKSEKKCPDHFEIHFGFNILEKRRGDNIGYTFGVFCFCFHLARDLTEQRKFLNRNIQSFLPFFLVLEEIVLTDFLNYNHIFIFFSHISHMSTKPLVGC